MKTTLGCVRKADTDFGLIGDGDRIGIGVSGGKDSSIAAALCAEALGKDRVVGVLMPNGTQRDISDSRKLVEFLGIPYVELNIGAAFDAMKAMGFPVVPYMKYDSIREDNVTEILMQETGEVFLHVLENAGVYKRTEEGRKAFLRFVEAAGRS